MGWPNLTRKSSKPDFPLQRLAVLRVGAVFRTQLAKQLLGLGQEAIAQPLLHVVKRLDLRPERGVLLVIGDHRRAADDQRRARFINQDRVHFVHDGVVMAALDLLLFARGHAVVAQIIEAELGVGAVGDVAVVLLAADTGRLVVQNAADRQAEELIDRAHPFAVARRQVIVHGDDVHARGRSGR